MGRLTRVNSIIVCCLALATLCWMPLRSIADPNPVIPPGKSIHRIAFGSCLRQDRPQPVWQGVKRFKPELFLLLGDNVYAKSSDMEVIKAAYSAQKRNRDFAEFQERFPILSVWDDNDYGPPDSGRDFSHKAESKEAFLTFFGAAPDDERRGRPGIYGSWIFGPPGSQLQIIGLDTRTFRGELRSNPKVVGLTALFNGPYIPHEVKESPPFLGEEQWSWLESELKKDVELRIILSSVQFLSGEHGYESWGNFPKERLRLVSLLKENPRPTVILSGDRHHSEISVAHDLAPFPIFDFTSSALNVPRAPIEEPNRYREIGPYFGENFGALTIMWGNPVQIEMEIRGVTGEVAFSRLVTLKDTAAEPKPEARHSQIS